MNYHGDRQLAVPAIYPVIFIGNLALRFGELLGNVGSSLEEDELRPGESGGVGIDSDFHVFGLSTATNPKNYLVTLCPGMFCEIQQLTSCMTL